MSQRRAIYALANRAGPLGLSAAEGTLRPTPFLSALSSPAPGALPAGPVSPLFWHPHKTYTDGMALDPRYMEAPSPLGFAALALESVFEAILLSGRVNRVGPL
jgi:hypothetical protein